MFKDPDLFELDQATRQQIYQAAQTDLDNNHNLSWRDAILNHAEREFKSRLGGYIGHLEHKSEQDSAAVLGQAQRIAELERLRSEDHAHAIDMAVEIERLKRQLEETRKDAERQKKQAKPQAGVVFCTYPKCQTTGMKCAGQCSQANGQGVPDGWQLVQQEDDNSPSDLDYSPGGVGVDGFAPQADVVGCTKTPRSDALEALRVSMKQERTPAYGDALALCRDLERQLQAPQAAKPLLDQIADLEDSLAAWRRNAELADQDNRRLEEENRELKKEVDRLKAAHESTVNLYSLPGKKV